MNLPRGQSRSCWSQWTCSPRTAPSPGTFWSYTISLPQGQVLFRPLSRACLRKTISIARTVGSEWLHLLYASYNHLFTQLFWQSVAHVLCLRHCASLGHNGNKAHFFPQEVFYLVISQNLVRTGRLQLPHPCLKTFLYKVALNDGGEQGTCERCKVKYDHFPPPWSMCTLALWSFRNDPLPIQRPPTHTGCAARWGSLWNTMERYVQSPGAKLRWFLLGVER